MICKSCFDHKKRVSRLQKQYDACIVENPVDLYYLTGLDLSLGTLVVRQDGACLFVDGRYLQAAKESSPVPVADISSLKQFLPAEVSFDSQWTTVRRCEVLKKLCPKPAPVPSLLQELRAVKDDEEIAALRKSAKLLWKGYEHLRKLLKAGISEEEAALQFELFCRKNGASGLAFDPIIAFGKNSAMPHYRAGKAALKKGDLVLCDIGVAVKHYRSDMTRVHHFGKIDPRLADMEAVVLAAHRAALKKCKAGALVKELDIAARSVMKEASMEELFVHSLGHGIGLETHEFPKIRYDGADRDVVLKAGMVITIEPGLYLPGVGGVRHEDTIAITKDGFVNFYA